MNIFHFLSNIFGKKHGSVEQATIASNFQLQERRADELPVQIGHISRTVCVQSAMLEDCLNTGCDYLETGNFDSAIHKFTEAIQVEPCR